MLILVICFVMVNKVLLLSFPNKSSCLCNYSPHPPLFFLSPIRSFPLSHFINNSFSRCTLYSCPGSLQTLSMPFSPSLSPLYIHVVLSFLCIPTAIQFRHFFIKSICRLTFLIDQTYFRFEGYLLLRFATPKIEL